MGNYARQRLLGHVKKWEKFRKDPYLDVDGNYAIGYGSHFIGGKKVDKLTKSISEADASAALEAYLTEREGALAKSIPNWKSIPSDAQDMLLDVAMGKRGLLSSKSSPKLHSELTAARTPDEMRSVVRRHYPTYRKAEGEVSEGLANRRADGLKTLAVQTAEGGGDTGMPPDLAAFTAEISAMPVAPISNPEEAVRNAARAEARRQDRIKNMWANIAIHEMERKERDKALHDQITQEWYAGYAAQRAAQERAPVAKPARAAGRAGSEVEDMMGRMETVITDIDGVKIRDGKGQTRRATAADLRNIQENKQTYRDLGIRLDDKGGEALGEPQGTLPAEPRSAAPVSGPRIVINPSTFRNSKDALCVAFNERFRIAMEQYGWVPKSEPTEAQRRFFSDTAYADDEEMLRRTIIARIIVLDTSVKDPTDAQLADAMEFLNMFREREKPSNQWEADALERIIRLVETVQPKGEAI